MGTYITFLINALRLDFGISYQSPSGTVTQIIGRTWPVSIHLGGLDQMVQESLLHFLFYWYMVLFPAVMIALRAEIYTQIRCPALLKVIVQPSRSNAPALERLYAIQRIR